MSASTYKFKKKFDEGKAGEWIMSKYHAPWYTVQDSSPIDDRRGIDQWYRRNGRSWGVQVKTDLMAQNTGNMIVETVSNDTKDIPGWAYTSQCDVLIFYFWKLKEVYYWYWNDFSSMVDVWLDKFGARAKVPNEGYFTRGIILPLKTARRLTFATRKPIDPYWFRSNYKWWLNHG